MLLAPQLLEMQPCIYFTTCERGVSAFSVETNQTNKIVESTEVLIGITYDSINNKLYFSTFYKIYPANMDKKGVDAVLNTDECETIFIMLTAINSWIFSSFFVFLLQMELCMALPLIGSGGNMYVATWGGYVLACAAGAARTLSCYAILHGQGDIDGISLDPTEG